MFECVFGRYALFFLHHLVLLRICDVFFLLLFFYVQSVAALFSRVFEREARDEKKNNNIKQQPSEHIHSTHGVEQKKNEIMPNLLHTSAIMALAYRLPSFHKCEPIQHQLRQLNQLVCYLELDYCYSIVVVSGNFMSIEIELLLLLLLPLLLLAGVVSFHFISFHFIWLVCIFVS